MIEFSLLLLVIVSVLAFKNWRHGFVLCVVAALLQDPLRKLSPGQPVYFVVFVGVVFGAALLGAVFSRVNLQPTRIEGWRQSVGAPFAVFLLVVILQSAHSLVSLKAPMVTAIGVMSYLAPIPALTLAHRFALSRSELGIRRWMRFYVVAASLALVTVYLEYAGFASSALGEVGRGVWISGQGEYYKGNAGVFRASEIAAWHAATVACFAFILSWGRRFSPPKLIGALIFISFLIALGALTGRRKMIVEVAIFFSVFFCLLTWFQRGNRRAAMMLALFGVVSFAAVTGFVEPDPIEGARATELQARPAENAFSTYTERAQTVFAALPSRLIDGGFKPISWAVDGFGWFGGGVGVGTQGAQHFGSVTSGAAEGGLGKLTVELGVPGLLVAIWLLVAFIRYIWRILAVLASTSRRHAILGYGIVAFMMSNLAAFAVATQAYGDLFILLTLGWSIGFLLSLPALAQREQLETPIAAAIQPQPNARIRTTHRPGLETGSGVSRRGET